MLPGKEAVHRASREEAANRGGKYDDEILEGHTQAAAMDSHNKKLTKCAAAAEIWQLSQTDLSEEEWAKYRGRCRPLHVQYKPLVDKMWKEAPTKAI